MADFGELFGPDSTAGQFFIWNVLGQLITTAMSPALADIQQGVNTLDPVLTLSPQELAVGAVRGILDMANSQSEAAKSGIGTGRFQQLVSLAKQPPSLDLILAAYQRAQAATGGATDAPVDVDAALTDLGINSTYWPMIKALSIQIPTAQQVLNAWLEGQIDPTEAMTRLLQTGMDPSWIQTAYNSEGQAPTPVEALELWNRGIITESGTGPDATSYEQAFLEGPWRNKWLPAFKALRFYLTPPRTVTAMLKEGSIDEATAAKWLAMNGLDADTAAAYLKGASHTTTVAQRELTQAQIIGLYEDQLITRDQAQADLVALKFTASDAGLLLTLADKKQAVASTKSAITRLQNLYLAGTNSAATTTAALHELGLTDDNVANLLATWNLEQSAKVRVLTPAQIVAAWYYSLFDTDPDTNRTVAEGRLVQLGYSATDAAILLEIRNKGAFPNG